MGNSSTLEKRRRRPSGMNIWLIIGGAALALVAVGVITQLPDIKRYIRISTM
jgi:hypothetical protein